MIQRRLAADEQLAEDRQQAAVEALFTAKRRRCRGSAGQTVGRQRAQQPAAVGNAQRALGGGSAPLPAEPRAELEDVDLSSRRRRAGAFDVGTLDTARGFALVTAERIFRQRLVVEDCHKIARPVIAHALLWLSRVPAMDGCAGTWSFGCTPYVAGFRTTSNRSVAERVPQM